MGRVNETNSGVSGLEAYRDFGFEDGILRQLLTEPTGDYGDFSGDEAKSLLFFAEGRYRQTALTALGNQRNSTNATGGATRVTAASSPEQLLRDPRVRAMLDAIAFAEGTGDNYGRVVYGTVLGPSDRNAPYNRSFVGKRNVVVTDFSHHPNLAVRWANGQPPSSAAGRYQFLYSTWKGLNMPDFSRHSQDIAAIKLMQRRGMIEPLLRGDFAAAIHKGAPEWASLPVPGGGSYYGGQGARSLSDLRRVYNNSLRENENSTPPPETTTPTSPNPSNGNNDALVRGQHNHRVSILQDKLIRLGVMTEEQKQTGPGIFGLRTERGVKRFQRAVGLNDSGRFDAATQRRMDRILSGEIKKGARGEIVLELQKDLVRLGFMKLSEMRTGPGIFGPRTDRALRRFQAAHNLDGDGIFGPKTFRAIRHAQPRSENQPPRNDDNSGNGDGRVREYRRWNVYSTGERPARLADGYEDLQAHHDYQSVNYVMRGLRLNHPLEARDIVLTRPGQSNFGQAVPAPITGKVLFAGDEGDGYGNKVVIKNERTGQVAMIGHLQSINVRRGETISYGESIGGQGSTGHSTGAHVHVNADSSVIRRWVADLADGKFDGERGRFDVGRRP